MKRSTLSALALALLLGGVNALAQGIPEYRLTQIFGPLPNETHLNLTVVDLNDRGEVIMNFFTPASIVEGVLWRHGQTTTIREQGDEDFSYALLALSDTTRVLGTKLIVGVGTASHFIWRRDQLNHLDVDPDRFLPRDLNSLGVIVGRHFDAGAFVKWRDHVRFLPALPGTGDDTRALRINELGIIAGNSGERAVIWALGRVRDLGLLRGAIFSEAADINDAGDVAVNMSFPDGFPQAALWRRGRLTELPRLLTANLAEGINNRGQVVGNTTDTLGEEAAVLWQHGEVYDLNDLIRADDPIRPFVTLLTAIRINNRGQILALGLDTRGFPGENIYPFLLSPTGSEGYAPPAPESFIWMEPRRSRIFQTPFSRM